MKAILSMIIVALFSIALAGCWFYSRPDSTAAGCQKTTYGVATATTTSENCPPDASASPSGSNVPPGPPPIPSPGTL
jgi:hypothetical protein